jgi:hypothetical protein
MAEPEDWPIKDGAQKREHGMDSSESRPALEPSDAELKEYVEAFKTSSDRARYALYVAIIASVLVGIANYNLQSWGWPTKRIETWYKFDRSAQTVPSPLHLQEPAALAISEHSDRKAPEWLFNGDGEQLRTAREEYLKQFISRYVFASSPIPGVWIDANDLGVVGGVALTLLMLIFAICIVREHENLYLSLYKVRSLAEADKNPSDPNSRANLLYHALAMRQVLSSPPTLARWEGGGTLPHFGYAFFAPVFVYGWVVFTNRVTEERGAAYGVNVKLLFYFQCALMLGILILSVVAWLHTRAMSRRWQRAFFRINPARMRLQQMSMKRWLKLSPKKEDLQRLQENLIARLVDRLAIPDPHLYEAFDLKRSYPLAKSKITNKERETIARETMKEGEKLGESICSKDGNRFIGLVRFVPILSEVVSRNGKTSWEISGKWVYKFLPSVDQTESEPAPGELSTDQV